MSGPLCGALRLRRGRFTLDSGPFEIPGEGVTVIFGRSGSGKSTLLRAIAGLEPDTRGTLRFGEEIWQDGARALPAHRRRIGFVFQDAALLPHLSVRGNLAYASRRSGEHSTALDRVAKATGIGALLARSVEHLSGGERQRVALARALLARPRLLCLDEPLAALDHRARAELLVLIEQLARDCGLPVLYVTHSPLEVERLADRVVFLDDGRIERSETLREALARPDSQLFEDEGAVSVLEGRTGTMDGDGLLPFVTAGGVQLRLALPHDRPPSCASRLRILAKDVSLALHEPQGISILNHLPATILALDDERDGRVIAHLRLADGQALLCDLTAHSVRQLTLRAGMSVFALIKSVALIE